VQRLLAVPVLVCLLVLPLVAREQTPVKPAITPVASHSLSMSSATQAEVVSQYCATCHSERGKAGGLSLAEWDTKRGAEHRDVTEKMIHKLRAGMMPPSGAKRPPAAVLTQFVGALESRMDALAAADPNPGWRPFQRLNRAEYAREIKYLLGLDVDITAFLPGEAGCLSAG